MIDAGRARRVVIVEDDATFASMIEMLLVAEGGFDVVGLATSVGSAARLLADESPDIVIIDHLLPDALGAQATPTLRQLCPSAVFVLVSGALGDPDQIEVDGPDARLHKRLVQELPAVLKELTRRPVS
jgi:DNA-binding NarL/FixJ family response regulator